MKTNQVLDLSKLLRAKFGLFNVFWPGNPGLQPCQTHVWCGKTKKSIKLPFDSAPDVRPTVTLSECMRKRVHQIVCSKFDQAKFDQENSIKSIFFKCCYVKRKDWFKAVFVTKEICFLRLRLHKNITKEFGHNFERKQLDMGNSICE